MTTPASIQTNRFRVHGMDCAEEVATLKAALSPIVPPSSLTFEVLSEIGRASCRERV